MSVGSRAGIVVGGLVLLAATVQAGVSGLASSRLVGVDARWEKSPGPLPDFAARYPRKETNPVARELETLAAAIGVDLTPGQQAGAHPSPAARRAHDEARPALNDWLVAELGRAEEPVEPPPEAVRAYLSSVRPGLDALAARLAEGPPPTWTEDVDLLFAAPLPNLLGHVNLSRLFAASALLRALDGEADADRPLRAAWALSDPLRERPELISRLVHLADVRYVAGALRKVPAEPGPWRARLSTVDPRALVEECLLGEAWVVRELARRPSAGEIEGISTGAAWFAARPWLRLEASRLLEDHRRLVLAARNAPVTDGDPNAVARAAGLDGSRSSLWGLDVVDVGSILRRADRLVVDLELTERLLLARDLRRAAGPDAPWPAQVEGSAPSRLAGASWTYSVEGGRLTIALSRETAWPGQIGLFLPDRFVSRG